MFDSLPISPLTSLVIIAIVSACTFLTRVVPFLLFPNNKPIPPLVQYLGKLLTPAIIGLLVIYCLKGVNMTSLLPTVVAVVVIVALHLWKRNVLLSVGIGTVLYMVLLQSGF